MKIIEILRLIATILKAIYWIAVVVLKLLSEF